MNYIKEKAYIINCYFQNRELQQAEESLKELIMLAETANLDIIKKSLLFLPKIDSANFISKGKLENIKIERRENKIDVVVLNQELKPIQVRNLEDYLDCKVIGRTELILDIFARNARSKEAKIQVELAQLKYLLPRLTGYGLLLSRLGGGVGTRGPGETKLEYDRRYIMKRISTLQRKLKQIEKHREILSFHRKYRMVSLVGYTNAGKTTLLNVLSGENLKTANRLFVTLDPIIRKVYLGEVGKYVLISDTVGFIDNIPHQLVASFKATLAEIKNSDMILHIVDINDANIDKKIEVVNKVLSEIGVDISRTVLIFNKIDKMTNNQKVDRCSQLYPGAIFISAKNKLNIDNLKKFLLIMK